MLIPVGNETIREVTKPKAGYDDELQKYAEAYLGVSDDSVCVYNAYASVACGCPEFTMLLT